MNRNRKRLIAFCRQFNLQLMSNQFSESIQRTKTMHLPQSNVRGISDRQFFNNNQQPKRVLKVIFKITFLKILKIIKKKF